MRGEAYRDAINADYSDEFARDREYSMMVRYEDAGKSETGTTIKCAACGKKIIKSTYHRKFCDDKCKNYYWNRVDGKRKLRARAFNAK